MTFDEDLKRLYARALVSIARADGHIDADEGERLRERLDSRCNLDVADVLLEPSLHPDDLASSLQGGPFRGTAVRPDEVARLLVEDGLYIALAKGHITEEEGGRLWRYATALGLSEDELRRLTGRWIP